MNKDVFFEMVENGEIDELSEITSKIVNLAPKMTYAEVNAIENMVNDLVSGVKLKVPRMQLSPGGALEALYKIGLCLAMEGLSQREQNDIRRFLQ